MLVPSDLDLLEDIDLDRINSFPIGCTDGDAEIGYSKGAKLKEKETLVLSRRGFLEGAASSAAIIAVSGLLSGCEASGISAGKTVDSAPGTISDVTTWGNILNPQEDFKTYTTDYSALFSPLQIAGKTLSCRIAKSAAGSETQHSVDWPSDSSLAFYEQFAKGGVGMIDFEVPNIFPGMSIEQGESATLNINDDKYIPAFKAIADRMHQHGTVIICQLYDLMMFTGASSTMKASAELEPSLTPGVMQTTQQIQTEQQIFVDAAVRLYKAGFDGIELNASCNHYFSTYLSRTANNERTDQYSGASTENRARILTEIIKSVREKVGKDFIIQVLYSGIEEKIDSLGKNETCTTTDEAVEFAKLFERAGASSLHLRSQMYGHHCAGFMPDVLHVMEHGDTGYESVLDYNRHADGLIVGKHDGVGALIEVAAKIKSAVSIPVGAVGSMDPRMAPDIINNAIADGKLDYILVTRSLLADTGMPNKLKDGNRDECAPCTHCMTCFVAPFDFGTPMHCRVNPAISRAYSDEMPEGYDPLPAAISKKVMVIGGGPAGMEAARIAAQRGHDVTLYEKSSVLGGTMSTVQKLKPHELIDEYSAWLSNQLKLSNVKIVTGKEVEADLVAQEGPDAVIIAIGGLSNTLDIPGAASRNIITVDSLKSSSDQNRKPFEDVGETVVVIGAQFQAVDVSAYLAQHGKKVIMLNTGAESELDMNAATWPREMAKRWLRKAGVKIYHGVGLQEITDKGIVFSTNYGVTETIAFDDIILMQPLVKNKDLFDAVSKVVNEVYAVGDCYAPNTIANATGRANIIGRKVGNGDTDKESSSQNTQSGDTFTDTETGIGEVTVTITVKDGKIANATVDTSNETEGKGKPLGTLFAQEIISSGNIDTVSGCTMTSNATIAALKAAKQKAGLS